MIHALTRALIIGASLFCFSCGGTKDLDASNSELGGSCTPGEAITCYCSNGTTASQTCDAEGDGYSDCECGGGSTPIGTSNELPCDVKTLVEAKCGTCHGSTPQFGAPMSLTSAADFAKPSTTDPSMTVGQMALVRINDDAKPMPQPPAPRLTDSEIGVLTTWVNGGAVGATCTPSVPTADPTTTPTTDPTTTPTTDPTTTPTTDPTTTPTTDPTTTPPDPPPSGVTCYEIRAHDPGVNTAYNVPQTPDFYNCFTFAPPWGSTPVQIVSARSLIDNTAVIHHWILYNESSAVIDGAMAECIGAHPSAAFVAGWAPGGSDSIMPEDVGLQVAGQGFNLEIHYNNNQGVQYDASGVELCVTTDFRPNTAAVHWLGTENINLQNGGTTTGSCNPKDDGPITILSSSPHMHMAGRHMKTVINRAAGGQDILIDVDFSFSSQVTYDTPAVIYPGDTLTTTCTYEGRAVFGQGTGEEMCYNFVTAYPAGALTQPSIFPLRQNSCI